MKGSGQTNAPLPFFEAMKPRVINGFFARVTIAHEPGERAIPHDARVTQLHDGKKEPTAANGHHTSYPWSEFIPLGDNVGIVLDGKFIVIDIDRPDAAEAQELARRLDAEGTWRQKTPHGRHWLFRVPAGFTAGNGKLWDLNENPYGDMKSLGYIVAPGSEVGSITYQCEVQVDPRPAPEWVLALHRTSVGRTREVARALEGVRRDEIPDGEHDNALAAILGQIARSPTARLGQGALERIARVLIEDAGILAPSTRGRPYGPGDYVRLARSAVEFGDKDRFDGRDQLVTLLTEGLIPGDTVDYVKALGQRWWVHGFIPRDDLVTIFARGGAGKSTAASWVAAEVTRKGGSVAVLTVEESFERFLARAVLGGANPARIYAIPNPTAIQFPRDIDLLRTILKTAGVDVLYIDSVMSHFSHEQHENAAERGRRVLGPIARMCKEHGITTVAVFHENKQGEFKGATEMVDVARHVVRVYRKRTGPATLRVWKTNLVDPGYDLALHGTDVTVRNSDGEVAYDEAEDGTPVAAKLTIIGRTERISQDDGHVDEDFISPVGE